MAEVFCPHCGCPHLYRQKDFNKKMGLLIVVLGIVAAYWTYGLSLVMVTLLDVFLFRRIREVGYCYRCEARFEETAFVEGLPAFDLELFDYYRNLKDRAIAP